jgi:hypothetical protein
MKIEPSSFVVSKKALSKRQKDMIINYVDWINIFITNEDDIDKFKNYEPKSWNITEYNDLIFGETSKYIFDMIEYLKYISVDSNYIMFDDGCTEPSENQLEFISNIKQVIKSSEIEKNENIKKDFKTSVNSLDFSKSKPSINGIIFNQSKSKRHEKKKK